MSAPIAETPRLRIREVRAGDAPDLARLFGDPQRVRFVDDGRPLDLAGCREWIAVCARNYAERGYGIWAVEERASGRFAGFAGISHARGFTPAERPAEVFYYFLPEFDGRGFATETLAAVVRLGFDRFNLPQLIATIHADHAASRRVAEKCGFSLERTIPDPEGGSTAWYRIARPG